MTARAGLVIATSSWGVNGSPACRLASQATFNSPSRFFEPLGAQSDPMAMLTPAAFAAAMSAVFP